jgi:hypothetical protein
VEPETREVQLRDALTQAWIEYSQAPPEEKDAVRERLRVLLEQFTALVMPEPERRDHP